MNRWDLIVEQFVGAHMAQFEDGDYVRYEDMKKMEDALKEIIFMSSGVDGLEQILMEAKEGLL